ncbi:MAG: 16S rRNA pseudouridine(516) synthase [Rhodospirillaceae bacterium]
MRIISIVSQLGYGSQKDVRSMIRAGRLSAATGELLVVNSQVNHADIRLDGCPLDPPAGMTLMMNKPCGYTCSTSDPGRIVYELLPPRFTRRKPAVATVGRLDRDTSGLLLLTDDGVLLHRIISPRRAIAKTYEITLARPLRGDEAEIFASGTLILRSESEPLAPARLEPRDTKSAAISIIEGRYHQVRRMFAALGNHVETLHRTGIGELRLAGLKPGDWIPLGRDEIAQALSVGLGRCG